jgi:hypothetical protein
MRAMASSRLFRTVGLGIVIALAQVACTAGSGSASPRATPLPSGPARTPSAECINPPPDLLTLVNQIDPAACYGETPITVEAEVVGLGAIDCAPMEPAWMACGELVALQPIGAQAGASGIVLAATTGPNAPPQLFAAIHPETALESSDIMGRPLRITGHFDDPAAQTCRQTEPVFDETTPPPPDISGCRNLFVLTAFEQL